MSKELQSMSKSMLGGGSAGMCPKHSGYELTYFNAKEGRKQCLMCIMRASAAEGGKEKERFCVKHPGYENSFYCANDQKVCCEKCLVYHKKHKVESIALKAENLREKFEDYKVEFVNASKQWVSFYNGVHANKESIEVEIDKTGKSIENIFDAMIERLKKRKADTINTFKKKAWGLISDFSEKYKECEADVKDIHRRTEEFKELEQLFSSGDNMELITKAMEINVEDIIDNYCPFLKQKLGQYRESFADLKTKSSYSFSVVNNFNEDEVMEFINKQFVVKIAKAEKEPLAKQGQLQPLSPEPDEGPIPSPEDFALHKFDNDNKAFWVYQGQTFKSAPMTVMKSPSKILKASPGKSRELPTIESWENLRSLRTSADEIYAFEGTDKGTSTIYKYVPESMDFVAAIALPFKYRKVTLAEVKGKIYVGGEPCEISEDVRSPQVYVVDPSSGEAEPVDQNLPRLSGFVLCQAKQRYIYAVPTALHNEKIYRVDLQKEGENVIDKEQENEELKEESKNSLVWEPITPKNPKNLNVQLFAPVWPVEIGDDSILLLTGKGSLIFNWKEEQLTEYAVLKQKDEFNDGAYRFGDQVLAYGKLGVHSYSMSSNKWSFIPQPAKATQ